MVQNGFNYRLHPALFSFIAASKDYPPVDFKREFSFVEIECGKGKTLLVLASLYPQSKFYGIDSDTENIEYAKLKAKELGLNNVEFLHTSFEAIKSYSFPSKLDYIALTLPYSSISKNERESLKEFVRKNLKEGGIFYLQFCSIPGSLSKGTFWKFIRELIPTGLNDEEKIEKLYELFEIFSSRPTKYLIQNPELRTLISRYLKDKDKKESRKELIREVISDFSFPMYFFEVFDDLKEKLELQFAGRVELELNDPEISLFPAHVPTILKFSKDVRSRETAVDFILNVGEHHDLWLKEPVENFEAATEFISENFYLLPRQKPESLRRILLLPGGHRFPLTAPIYEPFYSKGEEPFRLPDHPAFEGNKEAVKKAFYKVASSGEFFICCDEVVRPLSEIKEELPENFEVSNINKYLIETSLNRLSGTFLVSEVTKGIAIALTPLETVVFWFALKEGKSKAVSLAYDYLQSVDKTIRVKGESKKTKDISKEEVEKTAEFLFKGRKAFNLQRLNIVG